jgi:hypothetical protein
MLDFSHVDHNEARTARAVEAALISQWHTAKPLRNVKVPYSVRLEDLAWTNQLQTNHTLFAGKLRIRGNSEVVASVFRMYLATIMGSKRIA